MTPIPSRYVIYGAGAVGATLGAVLHLAGHQVVLIARGRHFEALAADGLAFTYEDRESMLAIPVVDHPRRIDFLPGDVVVLAMKGQDSEDALVELSACAPPAIPIVCAQNGVENERRALRRFRNVHAMCVLCPATHLRPGAVIAHSAPQVGTFDIGRFPSGVDAIDESLAAAISGGMSDSIARHDAMAWKYAKLIRNLGNAVEALFPDGSGRPEIAEEARREGSACLEAAGMEVVDEQSFASRHAGVKTVAPANAASFRGGGSTWQSLARGVGSVETDFLNGEIVLLGRLHGIATPVNDLLQELMTEATLGAAQPGSVAIAEFEERLSTESPRL